MNVPIRLLRPTFRELRADIHADILVGARHAAAFFGDHISFLRKLSIFFTPPLLCSSLYRLSHWLWQRGNPRLAWIVAHFNQCVHGAALSPAASIGPGLYIPHTVGVIFEGHAGENLVLFANAVVANGERHPANWEGGEDAPLLGNDVTVGAYAVVSGQIQIGDHVRIGPTAAVSRDVPAGSMVIGSGFSRTRANTTEVSE